MGRNRLWFRVVIYLMLAAIVLSTVVYSISMFAS